MSNLPVIVSASPPGHAGPPQAGSRAIVPVPAATGAAPGRRRATAPATRVAALPPPAMPQAGPPASLHPPSDIYSMLAAHEDSGPGAASVSHRHASLAYRRRGAEPFLAVRPGAYTRIQA